jgi:hypothetical protein
VFGRVSNGCACLEMSVTERPWKGASVEMSFVSRKVHARVVSADQRGGFKTSDTDALSVTISDDQHFPNAIVGQVPAASFVFASWFSRMNLRNRSGET